MREKSHYFRSACRELRGGTTRKASIYGTLKEVVLFSGIISRLTLFSRVFLLHLYDGLNTIYPIRPTSFNNLKDIHVDLCQ